MNRVLYTIDAFTNQPFSGNPAAVCVLSSPGEEGWMRSVAREMNLSETAFLYPIEDGWSLRWLTPKAEVKLCGHATLASAHALWETGLAQPQEILLFHTLSGWLTCRRVDGGIQMDFPARVMEACAVPTGLSEALGAELTWCGFNGMDYLVELNDENTLRTLQPQFTALAGLPVRGVIVTCGVHGGEFDFLSRFFAPAVGVNEDPVTGSAHCALGPYWQQKLGKNDLIGYQASERGGRVQVEVRGERVLLTGQAVLISKVELQY